MTDGEGLTEATIVTATSEKFYEEHPELVKAFLTAQKQVLDEMDADHAAAVSATAKATGLEEAAVEEMYGLYDFDMEIKDSDIEAMEKTEVHGRYRHDRKSGRCGISDLRCRVNDCGIESVCDIMGSKEKQGHRRWHLFFLAH